MNGDDDGIASLRRACHRSRRGLKVERHDAVIEGEDRKGRKAFHWRARPRQAARALIANSRDARTVKVSEGLLQPVAARIQGMVVGERDDVESRRLKRHDGTRFGAQVVLAARTGLVRQRGFQVG